jgi:hypothetical protein
VRVFAVELVAVVAEVAVVVVAGAVVAVAVADDRSLARLAVAVLRGTLLATAVAATAEFGAQDGGSEHGQVQVKVRAEAPVSLDCVTKTGCLSHR